MLSTFVILRKQLSFWRSSNATENLHSSYLGFPKGITSLNNEAPPHEVITDENKQNF